MTVTYTAEVASCQKFGCFLKLLARWRGSIYKIIWMDLVLFLTLYYGINYIYSHLLENKSKETFENVVYYCASYTSLIPLSFVLGFYVNLVMSRWWEQYTTIPWPDSIAVFVSAYVHGPDEGGRLMRRTVMRYVCLCLTIVFTMISPCVKKRFPNLKHLVDAGLLLENEKQIFEAMDVSFPKYPKHWMPIVWAASIITRARKEGRIRDDFAVKTIIDELNTFRGRSGTLMYYDFISIPLVYTQVVTIAVYSFFVCSLLAHQWTEKKKDTYEALDFYSPVFITLQFFFYMGWLKVAETLINPFGEDDDDFEVNWMIDRNLQVSYLIVDEMHLEHPELVRDQYWDEVYPNELPYESEAKREQPPEPSTAKYGLDDLPRSNTSKVPSFIQSISPSLIQNVLSRRSQRFNEAFQRFLSNSEDDETGLRTDVENSLLSVSDIENVQRITSYSISVTSQIENENLKETSILEPIIEEGEETIEAVEEEEMPNIEEEDGKTETESSYESDSDSDPFERLRLERQQERLQRMNAYLERHFGPNFRIVAQFPAPPEKKSKPKTDDNTSNNKSYPVEKSNEDEGLLTDVGNHQHLSKATIFTGNGKVDVKSISSLTDIENDKKLIKTKASAITTNDAIILHGQTLIPREDNKGFVHSNLPEDNIPLRSLTMKNHDRLTLNVQHQENISTRPVPVEHAPYVLRQEQDSRAPTTQNISSISSESPRPNSRIQSYNNNMPEGDEPFSLRQPVIPIFFSTQPSVSSSSTSISFKTKATSPMGSAISLSTQSSLDDDWEILPCGGGERRLENEESEDENKE